MGYLLVFNPLRHLISYFLSFSSFLFYLSFFFSLMLSLSLSLSLSPPVCFNPLLFLLVSVSQSITMTIGPSMLRWALKSLLSLWSVLMLQTSNGWWSGGASQAWLTVASRKTVFLWWDFIIAPTTLHVTLPDSLVTTKELLAIMALSIPWSSLIGLWARSVRLGHDWRWQGISVLLNSFTQLRGTISGYKMT